MVHSGSFKKGHAKTGGRVKGTPNKATGAVRNVLAPIISSYIGGDGLGDNKVTLEQDLAKMDPAERARIIANLVPFVMPKLAAVEVKEEKKRPSYQDELDEIAEI